MSTASSDVAAPDAVVRSFYAAVSGPADQERDRAHILSLFHPSARVFVPRPIFGGDEAFLEWDVHTFIDAATQFYRQDGFWERELASTGQRFGAIAHLFSTYEARVGSPDAPPHDRGVNSFQLAYYDGQWRIVNLIFDVEMPDSPLTDEHLRGVYA